MMKKQEIAILENAIAQLGDDSYLGPWLESVKFEVESMVRSDIFPDLSLANTAKRIEKDKESAKVYYDKLRTDTEKACADMISKAQSDVARYRSHARAHLNSIADKI